MEVAFDSEVKAELFMNKQGTIIGPEGTETIVSMSEAVKAGYKVEWKKEDLIGSKAAFILSVKIRNGTPVLPNEICLLELIEEIERAKKMQIKTVKTTEDEFRIESKWPQLKNAINWLLKNQF